MTVRMWTRWAVVASLVACDAGESPKPEGDDSGTPPDTSGEDTSGDDTSTTITEPQSPCADGGWGSLPDPINAIHVREDGDDTNPGTASQPVASLDAAVALSRASGAGQDIFVGPGTYDVALNLAQAVEDSTDDGMGIYGCSAQEVEFAAADDSGPVVKVSAVQDFTIDGVALGGGRRALWVWMGATATVSNVLVTGSTRSGVIFDGSETVVAVNTLSVVSTVAQSSGTGTEIGYGISIQGGAEVEMRGGLVSGSTGVGILVDGSTLVMESVTVEDTATDSSGYFGRGVQLQQLSSGTFTDLALTGNSDAGIFSLQSLYTGVSGTTISDTGEGALPTSGTSDSTGDGIVITMGNENWDVAQLVADLSDNTISAPARSGIVVESVTVNTCLGNTISDYGYPEDGSPSIIVQGRTDMPEPADSDPWTILSKDALRLNSLSLELDDLTQ